MKKHIYDVAAAAFFAPAVPFLWLAARHRSELRLSRRLQDWLGLTAVRNHYYEPVLCPGDIFRDPDCVRDLPGLDLNIDTQRDVLGRFHYESELNALDGRSIAGRTFAFANANQMFAEGDAEALYCFVRAFKPGTIVEIGSGQSTLVCRLAIESNRGEDDRYQPRHICFEPFENPWLEQIGAEIHRERIERADLSIFRNLVAGDIVFIDSSHVLRAQGDVECEILRILPILPPGVLVHIHDIYTPRDYLKAMLVDKRVLWTEQYMLEAFLSCNDKYQIVLALHHLHKERDRELRRAFPNLAKKPNKNPGSFWIQRV